MFSICRVSYLLSLKYSFCVLCAHAAVCNMKHLYPSTLELRSFTRSCKGNGAPPVVSLSPNTRQTARSTTGNSENSPCLEHVWRPFQDEERRKACCSSSGEYRLSIRSGFRSHGPGTYGPRLRLRRLHS